MPRITKRFVDSLKPTSADAVYWDDGLSAFGLRVRPSGAKTYVFVYRHGAGRRGRLRRLSLGAANISPSTQLANHSEKRRKILTAEEARKAAQKASAAAIAGEDPAAEKQAERADLTVKELIARYLKDGPASRPG